MSLDIPSIRNIIANRVIEHLELCVRNAMIRNIVFQTFPGCYSDDTEILTKQRGWVLFKDLSYDDDIACLNPLTKIFYWQHPTEIIKEQ